MMKKKKKGTAKEDEGRRYRERDKQIERWQNRMKKEKGRGRKETMEESKEEEGWKKMKERKGTGREDERGR